jgi:AraC-like DNA-binding protein
MTGRCIGASPHSIAAALTYLPALRYLGRGTTRRPHSCEPRSGFEDRSSGLWEFAKALRTACSASASQTRQPHRGEVEKLVASLLPHGEARIDIVARKLGCGRQTVYRRLKAEGLTFEQLRDGVRRRLSLELLKQGVPIKQIAYRVGFSEPSAFSRAFKRWTGSSPRKF